MFHLTRGIRPFRRSLPVASPMNTILPVDSSPGRPCLSRRYPAGCHRLRRAGSCPVCPFMLFFPYSPLPPDHLADPGEERLPPISRVSVPQVAVFPSTLRDGPGLARSVCCCHWTEIVRCSTERKPIAAGPAGACLPTPGCAGTNCILGYHEYEWKPDLLSGGEVRQ